MKEKRLQKKKVRFGFILMVISKSKISRTGMFKGQAGKYKGTKKGSYLLYNKIEDQPGQTGTVLQRASGNHAAVGKE